MPAEEPKTALPSTLARPAQRALVSAGVEHLEDLTRFSAAEIMDLHGIGPNAMRILQDALTAHGLSFETTRK